MTENGVPEALHPQCPRCRASCSRQCPVRGPIDSAGGRKARSALGSLPKAAGWK